MLDNEFPPLGGGTGVVNYHLLQEFSRFPDLWVDLVTSSRTPSQYELEPFSDRIVLHKVPVDNHNIHHARNIELLRYAWRGWRYCRALMAKTRYDLSFSFSTVPAGAISYALRRSHGLPYLVSLQGPDVPGFEERYNYLYPILRPILRRIWKQAGVVTAISLEHQRLAHAFTPNQAIEIVHNGVDTTLFHPAPTPRETAEIRIVSVGRLIERKGHHHLLRAFAELSRSGDIPLILTLVGTGDAEPMLHQLAQELNIADRVEFSGFVPRERMPEIYHRSDVFALASQSEGMSIALLEGMASGLPVVVTDTGGVQELVTEDVNGKVVPWADVPALTNALRAVIGDRAARLRMGNESLRVATKFGWESIAREYYALCQRTVAHSATMEAAS